jgi:hypothetical protein
MLYSNEFCLAQKLDAHPASHDHTGYYIDQTSTAWLRQIGQHKFFIRKLIIDPGSICPAACDGPELATLQTFRPRDGYLQFGALLRAIWDSDLKILVSFVDSDRYLDSHWTTGRYRIQF